MNSEGGHLSCTSSSIAEHLMDPSSREGSGNAPSMEEAFEDMLVDVEESSGMETEAPLCDAPRGDSTSGADNGNTQATARPAELLPSDLVPMSGALGLEGLLGFGGLPEGVERFEVDGVKMIKFPALFRASPEILPDVDTSELVDFSKRAVKPEAVAELVQNRLKKQQLVLVCSSLPHNCGKAGHDPNKKVRAATGNTPDWYAVLACSAPRCKTKLLVGGYFSQPPSPAKGEVRAGPTGLKDEVFVWGHPTAFEQKKKGRKKEGGFLSNHKLHCVCEHEAIDTGNAVKLHGWLKGKKRDQAREQVQGRRAHMQLLGGTSPGRRALGNCTEIPKDRTIVNQLRWESRRRQKPWGDDHAAGLKLVKKEHMDEELATIPRSVDSSNRILGIIQTSRENPFSVIFVTELMLVVYRALAKNGFGADYTAGIMKKIKERLPNGQEVVKQVLLFAIVAVNPYAGQPVARVEGAPPLTVMKMLTTAEDAHTLAGGLLELQRLEALRFGDNVVPSRFMIDCSMTEVNAILFVYNGENPGAYAARKLQEAFLKTTLRASSMRVLTDVFWCFAHAQNAKACYVRYELPIGSESKALRHFLRRLMLGFGELFTLTPDYLDLVRWLKVLKVLLSTKRLPLPPALLRQLALDDNPTPSSQRLSDLDVYSYDVIPDVVIGKKNASLLDAKNFTRFQYEGEGTLKLKDLIGSGGARPDDRSEVFKLSPHDAVAKFGPLIRLSLEQSAQPQKPSLILSIPIFGPKVWVRVSGEVREQSVASPCFHLALENYDRVQWRERAVYPCLAAFGPEALPKTNVTSESCFNIEKNLELARQKHLDPALYARESLTMSKAMGIRYMNLAERARSYKPQKRKKRGTGGGGADGGGGLKDRPLNKQQLQNMAAALPQSENSDEEWEVPKEFQSERLHGVPPDIWEEVKAFTNNPPVMQSSILLPAELSSSGRHTIHRFVEDAMARTGFIASHRQKWRLTSESFGEKSKRRMKLTWRLATDAELYPLADAVAGSSVETEAAVAADLASPGSAPDRVESALESVNRDQAGAYERSPVKPTGPNFQSDGRSPRVPSARLSRANDLLKEGLDSVPAPKPSQPCPPAPQPPPPPATAAAPRKFALVPTNSLSSQSVHVSAPSFATNVNPPATKFQPWNFALKNPATGQAASSSFLDSIKSWANEPPNPNSQTTAFATSGTSQTVAVLGGGVPSGASFAAPHFGGVDGLASGKGFRPLSRPGDQAQVLPMRPPGGTAGRLPLGTAGSWPHGAVPAFYARGGGGPSAGVRTRPPVQELLVRPAGSTTGFLSSSGGAKDAVCGSGSGQHAGVLGSFRFGGVDESRAAAVRTPFFAYKPGGNSQLPPLAGGPPFAAGPLLPGASPAPVFGRWLPSGAGYNVPTPPSGLVLPTPGRILAGGPKTSGGGHHDAARGRIPAAVEGSIEESGARARFPVQPPPSFSAAGGAGAAGGLLPRGNQVMTNTGGPRGIVSARIHPGGMGSGTIALAAGTGSSAACGAGTAGHEGPVVSRAACPNPDGVPRVSRSSASQVEQVGNQKCDQQGVGMDQGSSPATSPVSKRAKTKDGVRWESEDSGSELGDSSDEDNDPEEPEENLDEVVDVDLLEFNAEPEPQSETSRYLILDPCGEVWNRSKRKQRFKQACKVEPFFRCTPLNP